MSFNRSLVFPCRINIHDKQRRERGSLQKYHNARDACRESKIYVAHEEALERYWNSLSTACMHGGGIRVELLTASAS